MAETLTTKLAGGISAVGVKTDPAFHKATTSPNVAVDVSLADGAAADQANILFTERIPLATSGISNQDLSGALLSIFGTAVIFVKVKGILVINRSDKTSPATTAAITIAGNFVTTHYGVSTIIPLAAGDTWQHNSGTAGLAVTAGTGDVVTITNASGSETAEVDLIIVGTLS